MIPSESYVMVARAVHNQGIVIDPVDLATSAKSSPTHHEYNTTPSPTPYGTKANSLVTLEPNTGESWFFNNSYWLDIFLELFI